MSGDVDLDALPDHRLCTMNTEDAYNSCEKAEEPQEDEDGDSENGEDDGNDLETEEDKTAKIAAEAAATAAAEIVKANKKRAREEDKDRRKIASGIKAQQELDDYVAGLTVEQKSEHKKNAVKKNNQGQIPIHLYPKQYGDKKATKLLRIDLHFGADVEAQDKQDRTPLHYAVMNSCEEYEQALLAKGAHPFACDISDRCPDEY